MSRLAEALFNPHVIALVGASSDPKKNTARPQRHLQQHGYSGRVVPVNPKRSEVLGEPTYPSLTAIPYPIDHVYIMTPAAAVPGVIAECIELGIPLASIYSDGFAEQGAEGERRQQALDDLVANSDLRLLGPNSMGVVNPHTGMALTVNVALGLPELKRGSIGLISQSGSILGTLLSRGQARGLGFSKLVSVGNECDLSVGELVDLLVDDPVTETILLFLEAIRDPEKLATAARRAYTAGKPIIVYKLGRSDAGQALAVSHTGALAGDAAVSDAFFKHHGMVRVELLETFFELPALLRKRKPAQDRRAAVLTTTGGGAAMVVDRLGEAGVELISAPEQLRTKLADFGIQVGNAPLTDLTMAGTKSGVYEMALQEFLHSRECDVVIAVVGSSGLFHPEVAVEPIIKAANADKPLAAFIAPQADRSLELLAAAGVAAFRTPEACADGIRAYLDWSEPVVETERFSDLTDAQNLLAEADKVQLDEWQARSVFQALGVPQADAQVLHSPHEQCSIEYPVAVKILSPDIAHKTEAGGVALNINSDEALRAAMQDMQEKVQQAHPQAVIHGFLIQGMEQRLTEVLIGYRRDELGPIVTLGVGGVLAEIYRDVAIRMAPINLTMAYQMIAEVKGLAPIRGYRGMQLGDCEALAQAVRALSELALLPQVSEAEINPLIIKAEGEGVVAVDGLIVCSG